MRRHPGLLALALLITACDPQEDVVAEDAGPPPVTSITVPMMAWSTNPVASATSSSDAGPVDTSPAPVASASASASASAKSSAVAVVPPKPVPTAPPTPTVEPTAEPTAPVPEPPLAAPEAGSADEVAANIDIIFKDTTRFKARFNQKHTQKVSGKMREQQGWVYVERPNKISFHYDEPNKNRIVSDGTTLKLYVAEDSQMFEHPVKETEYPGAFGFIMGTGIRRSFDFTFNTKSTFKDGPVLNGKPKSANPQYEFVLFYVNKTALEKKDPAAVASVLIVDAQSNRNQFNLSEQSFPSTIDASEFQFTPPAGTTITK